MTTLMLPLEAKAFDYGRKTHNLPDEIVRARLREDLLSLWGDPYWACVFLSNGKGALTPSQGFGNPLPEEQCNFLMEWAYCLNKELHYAGHWITGVNSRNEFVAIWRDSDGDIQFEVGRGETWRTFKDYPIEEHVEMCSTGYRNWYEEIHKNLAVRPHETYRRALGEKASGGKVA